MLVIVALCVGCSALFISCSTRKNTAGTRFYHALTTKYNVYFNGREAYRAGYKAQQQGHVDNYVELLPLMPVGGNRAAATGGADFDRAIEKSQKAIREHSFKRRPVRKPGRTYTAEYRAWLTRREFNPFLHRAWMLMGQAQFAKGDWAEAAATFSYVARLYAGQPGITADARIWLAQCYAQLGWYYDAEDVLTKVNNDSLPHSLLPAYAQAYGGYLLGVKRYREAVPQLLATVKHEKNRQQRARQYYLLGQVYQLLGEQGEAYRAFKKVIRLSPPYELELNARIRCFPHGEMRQAMHGERRQTVQVEKAAEGLRRMTRSDKNKEYLDQIQYALGNVYLSSGDTAKAIAEYRLGVERSTRAGVEKGILQLTLGNLYWVQARYAEAQEAYAAAIGLIDKGHAEYDLVTKRSTVLDELVTVAETVQLQDSLQRLARMDSVQRMQAIERVIAHVILKEEEERRVSEEAKKADERETTMNEREAMRADMEVMRDEAKRAGGTGGGTSKSGSVTTPGMPVTDRSWYFYNPQLVAQGKAEFQRQWGRRKAEDNWRRRNKTVVSLTPFEEEIPKGEGDTSTSVTTNPATTNPATVDKAHGSENQVGDNATAQTLADGEPVDGEPVEGEPTDEKSPAYYLRQIPLTKEAMRESEATLSEALLHLGIIYKDQLEDYARAGQTLTRLISQFPDFAQLDEAYYNLYLLYLAQEYRSIQNPGVITADSTKAALIARFPKSKYALALSDPDFLRNTIYGKHLEDSLYANTYQQYRTGNYTQVIANAQLSATRYPMGAHRPKFLFLQAATALQAGKQKEFLTELKTLVQQYPENEITDIAAHILKDVQEGRRLLSGEASSGSRPVWGLLPDGRRFATDASAVSAADGDVLSAANDTLAGDSLRNGWSPEANAPFLFILAYEEGRVNENLLLYHLARYNFSAFLVKDFDLSFAHDRGIGQLIIRPFANHSEALYYFRRLYADPQMNQQLTGLRAVLISQPNYELLMRARSFDDYAAFYEQCFPHGEVRLRKESPAGDGSTLDEPLLNLPPDEPDNQPADSNQEEPTQGGVIYVP